MPEQHKFNESHGNNRSHTPRLFKDGLERLFLWAAVFLLVIVTSLSFVANNVFFSVSATLVNVFLSSYISYVITKHFAQQSAREELRDVARASGRHLFLLTEHISELAGEVLEYEPDGERSKLHYQGVASQMTRLAGQARASFDDIQLMAKADLDIPELLDQARTQVVEATRTETVTCPECGTENQVPFTTTSGKSRHVSCSNCNERFELHRLLDGSVKVGIDALYSFACPNTPCKNKITIRRRASEYGTAVRPCYECYARVTFDLDTKTPGNFVIEPPVDIPFETLNGRFAECPYCSASLRFGDTRNAKGERLQFCRGCTRLLRIIGEPSQPTRAARDLRIPLRRPTGNG